MIIISPVFIDLSSYTSPGPSGGEAWRLRGTVTHAFAELFKSGSETLACSRDVLPYRQRVPVMILDTDVEAAKLATLYWSKETGLVDFDDIPRTIKG